ncbi:hypothetical protein C4D60_Mb08t26460 [Musa balbisiana]|uniref:VDE lipocalin domain-containing protein n=1 Tax=Musa balbisiana TaxID=52838 RepID=A0A4S8K6Q0_MUSBA|nr:hypothetical protein C4D60_Mb08t26460 [Musa balbisiana]
MALPLATVTPILSLRRLQAPRSNCDEAAAATRLSGAREAALFGLKFPCCRATAVWDRRPLMVEEGRPAATARIVTVVGDGSVSPLKSTPWEQVMRHTSTRLKWVDEGIEMVVFSDKATQFSDTRHENLVRELLCSDMLVHVAINDQESIEWLHKNSDSVPNIICFESSPDLRNKLGGSFIHKRGEENMFNRLVNIAKKGNRSESTEVLKTVSGAWERKALQCLNSCSPTDQVCNYRCIASYESPYLEAFSLCVLQKNNCLELDAEIPSKPIVTPLYMFRGELLSHEVAEDLFIGWLDNLEWSWRVIAGQNPAYDQFPCQYQLFYRGKAKGSFWYEPVFQVRTQEGTLVWRRRKYRVRRASVPGTFYFSVLDNGVVSKEFWTIIDVCDDLSWGLFQYNGAAQVAGLSYTGAVLVSPDGNFKPELGGQRLVSALEKCSIMDWELYGVDNCSCNNPPLGIPEGSRLHSKIELRNQRWVSQQLG